MMRRRFLTLVLCLPFLLAAGCRRAGNDVARGNHDGILLLGNGAEPTDLDPHVITGTKEFAISTALFEGLASVDPVDSRPTPGVAESWDVSPDGLTYTFHLRADARWSNGDPVTAQDFLWSWQRVLTPALASEFCFYLFDIRGAADFNAGKTKDFAAVGLRAPDARTFVVTLEHPTPYFLNLLRAPPFFPVHRASVEAAGPADKRGTGWTKAGRLVGNGPFALAEWTVNKVVDTRKNPHYWDRARVRLNGVKFFPWDNLENEERAFRAGQLHRTYGVPFSKIDAYKRDHPDTLRLDPYARTQYLALNVRRAPLDDVRVRRALGMAIDREAIVRNITRGGELAAYALNPPDLGGVYTARARLPYDPAAARALLAEAGHPGGKDLPPVELLFNTSEANRVIAEAVQQMWKAELGVDATLRNEEWKVYLARRTRQDYLSYEGGWTTFYLDPTGFLELFVGGSIINQTGWANATYDRSLAEAARTLDPAARAELLQRAEGALVDEAPILPLYHHVRAYLLSPAVQGWLPNRIDDHPYKYVWLKE